jgi:hypothetical protein
MITDFVAAVAARVPGRLYLTLHPDPYPGHLFERAGLDLAVLDELVDAFVVPLCDRSYETTDWLEITTSGFASALDSPLAVQLSATHVDHSRLEAATKRVTPYAEQLILGGNSATIQTLFRTLSNPQSVSTSA